MTIASVRKWLRRVLLLVVALLPAKARHAFYRRSIELPEALPEGLRFEVAQSRSDLEAAYRLLHDVYVEAGFIEPQPSGMRLLLQHALPTTSTLVAKLDGRVVATVSLVRDNPLGLPMEKVFDLSRLRSNGERLVEISSLAIHPAFRRQFGGVLLMPLFNYLFRYSRDFFGVDRLMLSIYPRHQDFYAALFDAEPVPGSSVETYLGAPASAMSIDTQKWVRVHRARRDALGTVDTWLRYFDELPFAAFVFPQRAFRKINDPVMTPGTLRYFFHEKTSLFANVSPEAQAALLQYYAHPRYRAVLPQADGGPSDARSESRHEVQLAGRVLTASGSQAHLMRVLDVSEMGVRAHVSGGLRLDCVMRARLVVADGEEAELCLIPRWTDGQGMVGFAIAHATANWRVYVRYLAQDVWLRSSATAMPAAVAIPMSDCAAE